LLSRAFALLNRIPPRPGCGHLIAHRAGQFTINSKEDLEIRHLAAQRDAGPQAVSNVFVVGNLRFRTEKDSQGVLFLEILGKEFLNVASEQVSEFIQFDRGDGAVAKLDLGDRRARNAQAAGHILLR
jgi:hypothetical protein